MSELTIARVLTVAVVCCGVTPAAVLWLFMAWQSGRGKRKRKPDESASFDYDRHETWYWLEM